MPTRMNRKRFDALAGWCRAAGTRTSFPTVAAFSTGSEEVLAATYHDMSTGDRFGGGGLFHYVLLSRDAFGRFQVAGHGGPYITARAANKAASLRLLNMEGKAPPLAPMQSKSRRGIDLFSPVKGVTKLNPKFVNLRDSANTSAAREIMSEIARWFVDQDGNFVKDFQTTGFDSRIWELYLFATFTVMDFDLDRSCASPDFCLSRNGTKVFIEATTVNPTNNIQQPIATAPPPPPEELRAYNEREMAIKFGSPLETKIKKAYWKLPNVKDHPFVIAIADFHAPASMIWSQSALPTYLYGFGVEEYQADGEARWRDKTLARHKLGEKEIPSNFFGQERHRHVSAILSSNAGTQAKFNRMGVQAEFGDDAVQLVRRGGLHVPGDTSYEPEPFKMNVEDPNYVEDWDDEIQIFHNPNAIHPLDDDMFPTAANYRLVDGQVLWTSPTRPVLFSSTHSLVFPYSGPEDFDRGGTAENFGEDDH